MSVTVNTGNATGLADGTAISTTRGDGGIVQVVQLDVATLPVSIAGTVTTNTGLTQPLTDTQLRASAVPVSGTVTANTGLTQPLTDTQLRATALPISAASLPLPSGAAQDGTDISSPTAMPTGGVGIRGWLSAIWTKLNGSLAVTGTFWQSTQPVSGTFWQTTQPVSGPLTDTQIRATPLPISGTVSTGLSQPLTDTQLRASVVPISDGAGSLTVDAPVATPVFVRLSSGAAAVDTLPVSGPLTDTQIRATALPVSNTNLDVALSTRLKPADTLAAVTNLAQFAGTAPVMKAASTAAAAADAALVVAASPNSPIYHRSSDLVVTTLSTAATTVTLTIPAAGAGLFHYITRIEIVRVSTAAVTGSAVLGYTSTNLPGSWARSAGNAIAIGATVKDVDEVLSSPLKSSAANTATTIVAPSGGTGVQVRITVYYYTAA